VSKSVANFKACALASGLIAQDDLDEAEEVLRKESVEVDPADPSRPLAAKLVELGRVNGWQAGQLLEGRSKFNLGPYVMLDSLGQGGMGQVFKAEHTIMGRVVAVKVLPKSKSTPEAVASFNREVRTQAQLDHENLVRAHDAGHDGNVHFLVTEFVPGTDLRKLVRGNGKLSMRAAASIVMQAARGLEYAHNRGIIHRDIKPGNILVTPEGRTKVSDLGLAAFFSEEDLDDRKGKIVGTADYLAPEQVLNPGSITASCDIYSMGCTLYYAMTGKVPFPGGTSKEKARAHCTKTPVDPRRLNPDISVEFAEVIARMMAKDPRDRPQTAAEVIALLAPWADEASPLIPQQVGLEAARSGIGSRRAAAVGMPGDMEPSFLVEPSYDPGQEDSSSQSSQGTPSLHGEETIPMFAEGEFSDLPPILQGLIFLGSVTFLLMLAYAIAVSI